jgi:hypothetical protein
VAVTSALGLGLVKNGSAVASGSTTALLSAKSTTALQTIATARTKTIINKTTLILAISISPLLYFPDLYYTFKYDDCPQNKVPMWKN